MSADPRVLPAWATGWDEGEDGGFDVPIRPIRGNDVRLESGADGQPVIYTSYAFVSSAGTVEPDSARELAAALIEAAELLDGLGAHR